MPTLANLKVDFTADTSNLESGTGKVKSLIGGLTGGVKGLATVAGGFVLGGAITQVVGGVGQLARAGLDFEQQMANVNSVLQDDAAVDAFGKALIQLSGDPRVLAAPAELAAGFYNVASAGFTGQGALDVMTQAAFAATAGMTTADVAASAIAGTMNAYGQETYTAQQVSDALFGAVAAGSLTFEDLANNLGNTTALASQMGVGVNELATAYAVMSNNNISAAQAETQISAIMRSAANPTAALTEAVNAHGYATAEAAIAAEGFGGFIDMVTEASGGSKEALYDMLGTQEAVNAALILGAEGGSEYEKVLAQIEAGTKGVGATQLALAKQMDSANYKIAEARKQVQIAATLFMGALAPAIGTVAQAFSGLIQGATKFAQEFVSMMNPAANFSMWLEQFPGWAQPVIKLMAGLFQAGGDLVDAFQDFKNGDFDGAFRELQEAGQTALDALVGFGQTVWDNVVGALSDVDWAGVWSTFTSGLVALAGAGLELGTIAVNAVLALAKGILGGASDLWGWFKRQLFGDGVSVPNPWGGSTGGGGGQEELSVGTVLVAAALKLRDGILGGASNLWEWFKGKLGIASGGGYAPGGFHGMGGGKPLDLGDVALDAKLKIEGLITKAETAFADVKTKLQPAIKKLFDFDIGGEFGEGLGNRFGEWLNGLDWGGLFGQAGNILQKWGKAWSDTMLGGIGLLAGVVGQVAMVIGGFIVGFIEAVDWGRLKSAIGTKFREAFQAGSDKVMELIGRLSDSLSRRLGSAAEAVKTALAPLTAAFDTVTGAIQTLIDKYNALAGVLGLPQVGGSSGGGGLLGNIGNIGAGLAAGLDPEMFNRPTFGTSIDPMGGGLPDDDKDDRVMAPRVDTSGFKAGMSALPTITKTATAQLPNVFTQAVQPFLTAMKTQATSAVKQWGAQSGLGGMTPATQRASVDTIGAFTSSMTPISGVAGTAAGGAVRGFGIGIAPLPGNALKSAAATALGFGSGVAVMPGQAGSTATQVAGRFGAGIAPLPGQAGATARNTSGQFNSGISQVQQAVGIARNATSGIQGALGSASSGAYGYGYAIGAQFAAGLAASASLVASAAASIRNLLPSSPAKEGPLSEPVSWSYILDDLEQTMGRMPGAARLGMAGTARELAATLPFDARYGRSGIGSGLAAARGGQNVTIINNNGDTFQVVPEKLQKMMEDSRKGRIAYDEQQPRARSVALGVTRKG